MYTVYKLTCRETGLIYVGQTASLDHRIASHKSRLFESRPFDLEVLARCRTRRRAEELEAATIRKLDACNPSIGLNRIVSKSELSAETRKRMSVSQRRRSRRDPNPFLGCRHSEAARRKMRGPRDSVPRPWLRKAVRNDDTGQVYESLEAAAQASDLHKAAISRCCLGKQRTSGSFRWSFA